MKRFRAFLAAIALLSAAATATAGSLIIQPLNTVVNIGDSFDLEVRGQGFLETIVGGGFDFTFNGAALQLTGVSIAPIWEFVPAGGTIDNVAGTLTDASFNSFATPRSGDFNIATLSFKALAPGLSEIALAASTLFVFSDIAGNEITPLFGKASVVGVPEPGTVAMMLAGFALLALTLGRRNRTVAGAT